MIQFKSVVKNYGTLRALDNVTFSVAKGEFFALLGPNGAGKTSVIRLILNFSRPSSGSVFVNGTESSNPQVRSQIGYLPENIRIPEYLSGKEFLERHAQLCNLSGKSAGIEIDRVLELSGMKGREKERSGGYSKGMKQRIGLAASLINSPQILILDEPVNGLDPLAIREFRLILENLKNRGVTLLLNSHILSEVERLCTTAAILNKGKILVKDTVSNLIKDGETLEDVFVRTIGNA
ncbi:MAG: ABC transporter ATP-binding protein [Fibrobacter sp.]|nr:ABC transporter ATP-binding protein [Fibrobacter sp.]